MERPIKYDLRLSIYKIFILFVFLTAGFMIIDAKAEENIIMKTEQPETTTDKKVSENDFFFKDLDSEKKYKVRHSFFSTFPSEVPLEVTLVTEYESGKMYRININFAGEFTERYVDGVDRLSLGYFYAQDHSSTIYRIREEDMTDEIMKSEEGFILAGTVVCQEEEKKDGLEEEQKGWHQWITSEEDLREYHSYQNLTETGFYERFIWKRGVGLIYYTSGFGAEKAMIELTNTF